MRLVRKQTWLGLAILVGSVIFPVGCGNNSNPTKPGTNVGNIAIAPQPQSTNAPWSLSGPANYSTSGNGASTLSNLTTGTYTITWGTVTSYTTPATETQALSANATITFNGTYLPNNFVRIPAGSFEMGSPPSENGRNPNELLHHVTLTTPFMMATTEVTNKQFADLAQWAFNNGFCTVEESAHVLRDGLDGSTLPLLNIDQEGSEISFAAGVFSVDSGKENHPVKDLFWHGTVSYCDWLSLQSGLPRAYDHATWQCNGHQPYAASGFRLPTEAEWEYACRAGVQARFNTGRECLDAATDANYDGGLVSLECPVTPFIGWTIPVGTMYPANGFGLFNMLGNCSEWCNDLHSEYVADITDPVGPAQPDPNQGVYRVVRGGHYYGNAIGCRSAARHSLLGAAGTEWVGFRPVRSTN